MNDHDPWAHATAANRDYLTPEDITEAFEAGAVHEEVAIIVLQALGQRKCEDWSLCAFVAGRGPK